VDLFSDDARRDPFPLYDQIRGTSPVFREPASGLWMVFDYDGVNRVLTDHATFSSAYGPDWIVFTDPPRHTKLRALISRAFTPRSVANLEPRIREISRGLLDQAIGRGEMDLAADFSVPLPMAVIAEMLGIPPADRPRFVRWNDAILDLSHTIPGREGNAAVMAAFEAVTAEMDAYLTEVLAQRRAAPKDDLLTRLMHAELDGERLTQEEILGFFQGLLLAGSETTMNLINSAVLCFLEHPEQLALLRERPDLLPSAIEEVLRYRAPLQWMGRVTTREVEVHGQVIPARKLVLAVIGSANRDPKQFPDPGRFDIARDPNPHLAFGHGAHFCMGAPLARLEAKVALSDFLERVKDFRRASDEPWEPRKALHIHGPVRLPIRFKAEVRHRGTEAQRREEG
jgi:cytochrome P450